MDDDHPLILLKPSGFFLLFLKRDPSEVEKGGLLNWNRTSIENSELPPWTTTPSIHPTSLPTQPLFVSQEKPLVSEIRIEKTRKELEKREREKNRELNRRTKRTNELYVYSFRLENKILYIIFRNSNFEIKW